MSKDYYLIHKKMLPDYIDKVIYARNLLESKEVSTITEAVQKAGISRNTFYKYKDYIYEGSNNTTTRHATISVFLKDERGALSSVINVITESNANILTISQALPIANTANVLISLDISNIKGNIEDLTENIKKLPYTRRVYLDALE